MSVSTLTVALSAFHQNGVKVIQVNKSHPQNYHLYYYLNRKNRVMLVPKDSQDFQRIQQEITTLVNRTTEEQERLGALDGPKNR